MEPVQKHSVHTLVFRSLKRTHDMFVCNQSNPVVIDEKSDTIRLKVKARDTYGENLEVPLKEVKVQEKKQTKPSNTDDHSNDISLAIKANDSKLVVGDNSKAVVQVGSDKMLVPKKAPTMMKPVWHAPWKLYRVISGHTGWVRCIAFSPDNKLFATGAGDRLVKIWDLASGSLLLSLTGHVSTVRGVAISERQPYLFSCGEDKTVKCWDLEQNKVVRHYHGHMSAVHGIALHPSVDILVTCGRDSTARVWDMRTKVNVHVLTGHTNTVASVCCQGVEPQIITGSHDTTIRLWDIIAAKTRVTLTNHKKSVRALALHPTYYAFASGSADNIKQWRFPDGDFLQNLAGHSSIVNALAVNADNVLVSGGDNGSMHWWDWRSGHSFQAAQTRVQPGSIDSEAGIFALAFDRSGSRLLAGEADKTIKMYREDDTATEETHPLVWRPNVLKKAKY